MQINEAIEHPDRRNKSMKHTWSAVDVPPQRGRTAIITGGGGGIGYQIALQLATQCALFVLASRNIERTVEAARMIEAAVPGALVDAQHLDLGDLDSVVSFVDRFSADHSGLDILINNAAVSGGPHRLTKNGCEIHFQVNYLGHFLLTDRLLPSLKSRPGSRVVSVSSDIAAQGRIDFDDLQSEKKYGFIAAYAQSKLANLLFGLELERRLRREGADISSLVSNPGVAKSNLLQSKK